EYFKPKGKFVVFFPARRCFCSCSARRSRIRTCRDRARDGSAPGDSAWRRLYVGGDRRKLFDVRLRADQPKGSVRIEIEVNSGLPRDKRNRLKLAAEAPLDQALRSADLMSARPSPPVASRSAR